MAKNKSKSTKNNLNIPSDNIIDLRKVLVEEEKKQKQEKKKFFDYFYFTKKAKSKSKPKKIKSKKGRPIKQYKFEIKWSKIGAFSIICLFLIVPLFLLAGYQNIDKVKGRVLGVSVVAMENLKSAGTAAADFDLEKAQTGFVKAGEKFEEAEKELGQINGFLLSLLKLVPIKGKTITSGQHLLKAGKDMAEIGQLISEKIKPLTSQTSLNKNKLNLAESLINLNSNIKRINLLFNDLKGHLNKVDADSLPPEYREEVKRVQNILPEFDGYISKMNKVFNIASGFLAPEGQKEYLFLFQNNSEIRPTGGFIGSLALVNVNRGQIKILEVPPRGPYEINDDFQEKIIPPKPLWLINNQWQIQDANWFADFPTSAEKINWFYEKARGFSVDGIVTLTPDVVVNLLEITGPITLDKYETVITSDNFIEQTQKQVELEYDKEVNQPKQIIADLIPLLLEKIFNTQNNKIIDVINTLQKSLKEKDILIYFEDEDLQNKVEKLNWGGQVQKAERDYLMVVNTNIGGGKTDRVIKQEIYHQAEIKADGRVIDTLTIQRRHNGNPENYFTKIKNMDYLRVYVPPGSQLIEVSGFDQIDKNLLIYPEKEAIEDSFLLSQEKDPIIHERSNTRITQEFNKTVFANWIGLEVGESQTVTIKYKLPFKIKDKKDLYSLYIQKQPGAKNSFINTSLTLDQNYQVIDQTDQNTNKAENIIEYSDNLDTDKAYGVILEKNGQN
ncbi:MAG: DUF4012 domain-containing protein [Patescibacteria group bacterium]|nr:DUF4012 domain-containing protein [Patescibacteria group bacterium]